jgi:hypothetical protein
MSSIGQSVITLQTPNEIQSDLRTVEPSLLISAEISDPQPSIASIALHPDGSLRLGLTQGGSPLLLDLYDPAPGPLLVAGDECCGKTAYLQSLVQESIFHDPGEIQFGVLSPFTEEWTAQEALPNCMGIWPAYHSSAQTFLSRLISWAEILPFSRQFVLVLFDDFELLTARSSQLNHDLRWLLINGPQRHIWPVVSCNPGRLTRLSAWLIYYRTRILGQVKLFQTAQALADNQKIDLAGLLPGRQFFLSHPNGLQKFWLPSSDAECVS